MLHPHSGGPARLLHEGPRQRGLTHHDGAAEQAGVRHRCPEAPAVRPHRPQPWEQEPPQAAAPQVSSELEIEALHFSYTCTSVSHWPQVTLSVFDVLAFVAFFFFVLIESQGHFATSQLSLCIQLFPLSTLWHYAQHSRLVSAVLLSGISALCWIRCF